MADNHLDLPSGDFDLASLLQADNDGNNDEHLMDTMNFDCKCYDVENFQLPIKQGQNSNLKTLHINIHSLPDKFEKLKLLIHPLQEGGLKIDIILQ